MVFLRYAVSGATAAATHLAVLIGLVELYRVDATLASTIGFCAAIAVNYTLQYYWTFTTRTGHRAAFIRYLGVTLGMLIVNSALFWLLHIAYGLDYRVAQIAATSVVMVANYYINRRYTFAQSMSEKKPT